MVNGSCRRSNQGKPDSSGLTNQASGEPGVSSSRSARLAPGRRRSDRRRAVGGPASWASLPVPWQRRHGTVAADAGAGSACAGGRQRSRSRYCRQNPASARRCQPSPRADTSPRGRHRSPAEDPGSTLSQPGRPSPAGDVAWSTMRTVASRGAASATCRAGSRDDRGSLAGFTVGHA
jgi:hypothetical protein